jgi:hypothetical protein
LAAAAGPIRPPVIAAATADGLEKLLDFRHFFRVQYGVELDVEKPAERAEDVPRILLAFRADIEAFMGLLERAGEE